MRHLIFILCLVSATVISSTASADQSVIPNYRSARDNFVYKLLYPSGGRTLYCNEPFLGRAGLQVEHVLPASWMKEAASCEGMSREGCRDNSSKFNFMEADLHNLWPALAETNQKRSNYLFSVIGEDQVDFWNGFCDFEVDVAQKLVEPRSEIRGEIARMVLYMVDEYEIVLPIGQLDLMVEWHCSDNTLSSEEIRRNLTISELQGTRNSYIDNQNLLCGEGEVEGPPEASNDVWEDCVIKGNINSSGDKIFHSLESPSYNVTKINTLRGERWFCSEADALAAGWRAPH